LSVPSGVGEIRKTTASASTKAGLALECLISCQDEQENSHYLNTDGAEH